MRRHPRPGRGHGASIAVLCAAVATGPGCGAGGFDGTVYRGDGFAFRVPRIPAGWEPLDIDGAALAFRDAANAATIAVNARCGQDGDDVPLQALTHHLFLQFTEREVLRQELVPFDGREALHTVMTARLDGVPKTFDVWVLKKDGCVYDLLYIAQPDRYDAGAPAFLRFVHGFATVAIDGD